MPDLGGCWFDSKLRPSGGDLLPAIDQFYLRSSG
jgi:hypothetical protein